MRRSVSSPGLPQQRLKHLSQAVSWLYFNARRSSVVSAGVEQGGRQVLRPQAFAEDLPNSIANRIKAPFASGAGIDKLTEKIAGQRVSQEELERHPQADSGFRLNSPAELYYYRIFKQHFQHSSYSRLVVRWDPFLRR